MRKHYHKGISVYTALTKTLKVQSIVIYRRHNKVKIKTSRRTIQQPVLRSSLLLLLGPVANATDVLQPYDLLYYPTPLFLDVPTSASTRVTTSEILAAKGGTLWARTIRQFCRNDDFHAS